MTPTRFAFVKAQWHAEIVDQSLLGFKETATETRISVYNVPGAFELPLRAKQLAKLAKYDAIVAVAFVVDGGIYRHDFVANAVVNGLMQVGLETDVPVLSVCLTPHHFQETQFHIQQFQDHFRIKGQEAAMAALNVLQYN